MSDLSEMLKVARKAAGLSLREAGRRCGLSYEGIHKYEKGLNIPRPRNIIRLARTYGLPDNYFGKARRAAILQREQSRPKAHESSFTAGNIIKGEHTKRIQWRVLQVHRDGTLDVERVIQPPRKTIKRPEFYRVVSNT